MDAPSEITQYDTPDELLIAARGAELQAEIHSRIVKIAESGAEETVDDQVRIGALAWSQDVARVHRMAARSSIELARDLHDQAARLASV